MFVQKRDYGAFLQTVRVNVGKEVGLENDEDAYIVLRELPTLEMMELRDAYSKGLIRCSCCRKPFTTEMKL